MDFWELLPGEVEQIVIIGKLSGWSGGKRNGDRRSIRSLSIQEDHLTATNDILTQEYETESHRLSLMTRSQDEIKRLADQLDDNEVQMKLQTEIRRLVDRVVLHMKIQKFIIYYHTPKWIVRFKSGKSQSFIETDGELIDDPV